jgi:hypothetical protein
MNDYLIRAYPPPDPSPAAPPDAPLAGGNPPVVSNAPQPAAGERFPVKLLLLEAVLLLLAVRFPPAMPPEPINVICGGALCAGVCAVVALARGLLRRLRAV